MSTKLAELFDLMIPAGDGMPGASDLDLAGAQLDQVLAARPDLEPPLRRLAERTEPTHELLPVLEQDDPEAYDALCLAAAGGYYMHPEVRSLLGYDGQEPVEVRAEIIPGYVEDGLLDPVLERGERYRAVPGEGSGADGDHPDA